jgi:hypothetical protein
MAQQLGAMSVQVPSGMQQDSVTSHEEPGAPAAPPMSSQHRPSAAEQVPSGKQQARVPRQVV